MRRYITKTKTLAEILREKELVFTTRVLEGLDTSLRKKFEDHRWTKNARTPVGKLVAMHDETFPEGTYEISKWSNECEDPKIIADMEGVRVLEGTVYDDNQLRDLIEAVRPEEIRGTDASLIPRTTGATYCGRAAAAYVRVSRG